MDEELFQRLSEWLHDGPVVLASVLDTRGATPRKGGSRMLIAGTRTHASVGGGEAEARVLAAARALLLDVHAAREVPIDLSGRAGAAGVCGGAMRILLRRWDGAQDRARAQAVAQMLHAGTPVPLSAADLGADDAAQLAHPDARLLIVGGGHCAHALIDLAQHLAFDLWLHDPLAQSAPDAVPRARYASGPGDALREALQTSRAVYAVLLNRDYHQDVAALRVLAAQPPAWFGMMGSRKRIAQVRAALPECEAALANLVAPVGIEIEAQTPHEIAVSILAQLIQHRAAG